MTLWKMLTVMHAVSAFKRPVTAKRHNREVTGRQRSNSMDVMARSLMFIVNTKISHRKSRMVFYKKLMREMVDKGLLKVEIPKAVAAAGASSGSKLSIPALKEKSSGLDKRKQGDASMYTYPNMSARDHNRSSLLVIAASERWWSTMERKLPSLGALPRPLYVIVFTLAYERLLPFDSFRDRVEQAYEDYAEDAKKSKDHKIDLHTFLAALFELADVWTDTTEESEYVDFLNALYREWSADDIWFREYTKLLKCYRGKTDYERSLEDSQHALKAVLPDPYERYVRQRELENTQSGISARYLEETSAFKYYRKAVEDRQKEIGANASSRSSLASASGAASPSTSSSAEGSAISRSRSPSIQSSASTSRIPTVSAAGSSN
ncbi:putative mitochondrial protein [Andalucia godoyi]|uniref:Putative mitochondrial protein n=1 Tax=Andalucia godoyi TaxID=505711 RepID=A0A8K0AJP6_ANDGO|nr:putative mitochondrial protein [Andalucia godoyi]|eukprot:ANDGO_03243.mRNA.1 putative mitochondrial protein